MTVHTYNYPTTILHGPGASSELAKRLAAARTGESAPLLLVTDPGPGAGRRRRDRAEPPSSPRVWPWPCTGDVHPNPVEADVTSGVARYRDSGASAIVALGGGSPMDVAKAIAVLATHDGPLSRFDDGKGGDRLHRKPAARHLRHRHHRGHRQRGRPLRGDHLRRHPGQDGDLPPRPHAPHRRARPRAHGRPARETSPRKPAWTRSRTAWRPIWPSGFHPMADAIALGGMELVIAHLPRAVSHPDDLDARGSMLMAASMGATAFQKGLGIIHSMAHPLSTRYGIHHGLANALLMPPVLGWQLREKRDRFGDDLFARHRRVAQLFGKENAEELPLAIAELNRRIGIETTLSEQGLRAEDIPALAIEAHNDGCHQSNPIALTRSDIEAAFRDCL